MNPLVSRRKTTTEKAQIVRKHLSWRPSSYEFFVEHEVLGDDLKKWCNKVLLNAEEALSGAQEKKLRQELKSKEKKIARLEQAANDFSEGYLREKREWWDRLPAKKKGVSERRCLLDAIDFVKRNSSMNKECSQRILGISKATYHRWMGELSEN